VGGLHSVGKLTIRNEGSILTETGTALKTGESALVTNSGTVKSVEGIALEADAEADITNTNLIQGGAGGLHSVGALTIRNEGDILTDTDTALKTGESALVTNSGTVKSTEGIALEADAEADITNTNLIEGGTGGLHSVGALTIRNEGDILTDTGTALKTGESALVTNSGTVKSTVGIALEAGTTADITNTNLIEGKTGGLHSAGTLKIRNEGRIVAEKGTALKTGEFADVYNRGSIIGVIGLHSTVGLRLDSTGVIEGTGGIAILTGDGDSDIFLRSGSVLYGDVVGGNGFHVMNLAGDGLMNTRIRNFDVVNKIEGGAYRVTGVIEGADVHIENGRVHLQGTIQGKNGTFGKLRVGAAGILSGNGTIHSDVINAGLIQAIDPGNNGPLTIEGDYVQDAEGRMEVSLVDFEGGLFANKAILKGGQYQRESDGAGESFYAKGLTARGDVTLGGEFEIFRPQLGYRPGRYRIVEGRTVEGTFDSLLYEPSTNDFISLSFDYQDTYLDFVVEQKSYLPYVKGENARRTAASMDKFLRSPDFAQGRLLQTLNGGDDEFRQSYFDSMRPSQFDGILESGQYMVRSLFRSLQQGDGRNWVNLPGDRPGIFVATRGWNSEVGSSGDQAAYDFSGWGNTLGIEMRYSDTAFGLFADVMEGGMNPQENSVGGSSRGYGYGLYINWQQGGWNFHLIGGAAKNQWETSRPVTGFGNSAKGETEQASWYAALESSYEWKGEAWSHGPFASLSYQYDSLEGFEETGAGINNLRLGERNFDSFLTEIGWRGRLDFLVGRLPAFAEVEVSWLHELGDTVGRYEATYAGGGAISPRLSGNATDYLQASALLGLNLTNRSLLYLGWEMEVSLAGDEQSRHRQYGNAGLRISF
jgi:hypothetical protein